MNENRYIMSVGKVHTTYTLQVGMYALSCPKYGLRVPTYFNPKGFRYFMRVVNIRVTLYL